MNKNTLIIGVFVKKNKILSFLETLKYQYRINIDKVFIYHIETNRYEYLATFKTNNKDEFIGKLQNSTVMHTKNGCIFSINALNKLIDTLNDGDVPNNEFIINWDDYKDTLIIQTNGELKVSKIVKIDDKSIFFK
jgi:hypothetical protein